MFKKVTPTLRHNKSPAVRSAWLRLIPASSNDSAVRPGDRRRTNPRAFSRVAMRASWQATADILGQVLMGVVGGAHDSAL